MYRSNINTNRFRSPAPRPSYNQRRNHNQRKSDFIEDQQCAFFLGKLNKHLDRDTIYNQLIKLAKQYNFYVKKLDMPYGAGKRGNKGYAFVHTRTSDEARRMIEMKNIKINNQWCEVKPYGGRHDGTISPCGLDSGNVSGITTPRKIDQKECIDQMKEIERVLRTQASRSRTSTMNSASFSEEAEEVPEETQAISSAETIKEQPIPEYDHLFNYDNAKNIVLKHHTEALNSGMTSEQFMESFSSYYDHYMCCMENSSTNDLDELKYGLALRILNAA